MSPAAGASLRSGSSSTPDRTGVGFSMPRTSKRSTGIRRPVFSAGTDTAPVCNVSTVSDAGMDSAALSPCQPSIIRCDCSKKANFFFPRKFGVHPGSRSCSGPIHGSLGTQNPGSAGDNTAVSVLSFDNSLPVPNISFSGRAGLRSIRRFPAPKISPAVVYSDVP